MPSIQTLIGKRFEEILKEKYPELRYIGDEDNVVPDFEHPLFYAEAKAAFMQHDYAVHLKQYQIESFKHFESRKPVLYLIGFHNFENSMKRLGDLSLKQRKNMLSKEMDIVRMFIVDNSIIKGIWQRRNYVCEKGHIQDCSLRESHLRQIIDNSQIQVFGKEYSARGYYKIPKGFCSSQPIVRNKGIDIGYIMPSDSGKILDYFYK
jgi:hypothetical protein